MSEDHGVMGLSDAENQALNVVAAHVPPNEDWDDLEAVRNLLAELVLRRKEDAYARGVMDGRTARFNAAGETTADALDGRLAAESRVEKAHSVLRIAYDALGYAFLPEKKESIVTARSLIRTHLSAALTTESALQRTTPEPDLDDHGYIFGLRPPTPEGGAE